MSEIATLAKLEIHLSQSPSISRSKGSLLEAYFTEINHGSFANSAAQHVLTTDLKPSKHNSAATGCHLKIN